VHLIFVGEKSKKPTAAPLLSQTVFELHLRVEFKELLIEPPLDLNTKYGISIKSQLELYLFSFLMR